MAISNFPPHENATPDGLLAIGGDLEVESLRLAYSKGIFPWPADEGMLAWFSPPKRFVLFLDEVVFPRSLLKSVRKGKFTITKNKTPAEVLAGCSEILHRKGQSGTWITDEMQRAYLDFFYAGYVVTYESWLNETLAGGLYGVKLNNFFAGESMFYRTADASKVAFYHLVQDLIQEGITFIDCQVYTPLFASFGAREIPRTLFLELLREAIDPRNKKENLQG